MPSISKLVLSSLLVVGCAAPGRWVRLEGPPHRGQVVLHAESARVVVAGPDTIHAYAEVSGGAIYAAPAVMGTDADCRCGARTSEAALAGDRVVTFVVGSGQVACVASARADGLEVLWHSAHPADTAGGGVGNALLAGASPAWRDRGTR